MNNLVLSEADHRYLVEFVKEVLVVCGNDQDGITYGLDDVALNAGVILGLSKIEMEEIRDRG